MCGQLGAAAGGVDSRSNGGRCLDSLTADDRPVVVDNFTWLGPVEGGESTSTSLLEPVSTQTAAPGSVCY